MAAVTNGIHHAGQPLRRRCGSRLARAVGVWALCAGSAAYGAPTGWVLNSNQTMHLVDLASNAEWPAPGAPFASDSLAASPAGTLYSADASGNLWDITVWPVPVGPTMRPQIADLHWSGGGLWGYSNATQELFFFDLGTTSVSYAVALNLPASLSPAAVVTGVAHQAGSGDTFLSAFDGPADLLLRVPAASGTALLVGAMAHGDSFSHISDIEFDAGGTLVAMTWFHRWFYSVDPATAATTLMSVGPHRDSTALALLPVPEPATTGLLGLGLAMVLWRARGPLQRTASGFTSRRTSPA